jgi:mannosyltransferase
MKFDLQHSELILGNSNRRFSGVTSTMLQTLAYQKTRIPVCVLGKYHLAGDLSNLGISFWQAVRIFRTPLANGKYRVFHARRNNEMIQALILKHVFRIKLKIIFTSTAQRHHSRFTKWLMSKMTAVLSTCNAAASYLDEQPYAMVAHGVRSDIYTPDESKRTRGIFKIGIFGRVRAQKGTHLFVEAALSLLSEHPDVVAYIIGAIAPSEEQYVSELESKIEQANLSDRIQFLGEQDFNALPGLFQSTNVVTALSDKEGFGLTVLEAMSSGAAVIATEAGAWPEIIEQGQQGWTIPVGDLDALVEKLEILIQNRELAESMGKNGRQKIVEKYQVENEAEQLCNIYRQIQDTD